jgi:hypothetical protein
MEDIYNPKPRRGLAGMLLCCLSFVFVLATLIAASIAPFRQPGPDQNYRSLHPRPGLGGAVSFRRYWIPDGDQHFEIGCLRAWTHTPTITETPPPTSTPTPEPTATDTPLPDTPTPGPTAEAPFVVQPGSNVLVANFANDSGCAWMGVAGQVFDKDRNPLVGISVHVEGQLAGQLVDQSSLTGSNPRIGPAGYTVNLSDHPIASSGTMWIQLSDTAGLDLSEQVYFKHVGRLRQESRLHQLERVAVVSVPPREYL